MPSHRPEALLLAAWLAAAACVPAAAQAPTRDEVDTAAQALRQLPSLTGSETRRELRLKRDDPPPPRNDAVPGWFRWLRDFIAWLNDAGRWLIWLLGALAVAWLALRLRRLRGGVEADDNRAAAALPTHVRELDIRPQTLPADIGGAALALWQAGDSSAALSLLYRGALSRLVHGHAVPIRASSTEGDCLRLAQPHLAAPAQAYLQALVDAWRGTVYGGQRLAPDPGLCNRFEVSLGAGGGA